MASKASHKKSMAIRDEPSREASEELGETNLSTTLSTKDGENKSSKKRDRSPPPEITDDNNKQRRSFLLAGKERTNYNVGREEK